MTFGGMRYHASQVLANGGRLRLRNAAFGHAAERNGDMKPSGRKGGTSWRGRRLFVSRRSAACLLALALALAPALCRGEESARDPGRCLPKDTVLLVRAAGWQEWGEAWRETALAKIMAEPEVQGLVSLPGLDLAPLLGSAGQDLLARVRDCLKWLGEQCSGPVVFVMTAPPEGGGAPQLAVALGLKNARPLRAKVEVFSAMVKMFAKDLLYTEDYNAAQLIVLRGKLRVTDELALAMQTDFSVAMTEKFVIAATKPELARKLVDGFAGTPAQRLEDNPVYQECAPAAGDHLSVFVDVAAVRKLLGRAVPAVPGGEEALALTGLSNVRAVSWGLRMNGAAFESRTGLVLGAGRSGLLGALDAAAVNLDIFKVCREGAPAALGLRLKKEELLSGLSLALTAMGGSGGAKRLEELAKQRPQLAKELGETFGADLVLTTYMGEVPALNPRRTLVAALAAPDAAKADALLQDLQKELARLSKPEAEAKVEEFEGCRIRWLAVQGPEDTEFRFAAAGGCMIMAQDPLALKAAIRACLGKNLAQEERFQQTLAAAGKPGALVLYVDGAWFYRLAFQFSGAALEFFPVRNRLPPAETVAKRLFPTVLVATPTAKGVMLTGRGPLPSAEVLAPSGVALAVLIKELTRK